MLSPTGQLTPVPPRPQYIQAVLATGEHREAFLTGLERAMEQAEAELGCALHACSARAAEPLVARLSREHAQAPAERPFFGLLKQLVVAGYYTSAVGLMALEGTTRSMYPAYPGACPDGKIGALAP